jgi:hypothetical protein
MLIARIATCIAALGGPMIALAASPPEVGEALVASATPHSTSAQVPATLDTRTVSCSALKDDLSRKGQLHLLDGPGAGWADTFYGPGVPQCQFWLRPRFTYVPANDGQCGVGYICAQRYGP